MLFNSNVLLNDPLIDIFNKRVIRVMRGGVNDWFDNPAEIL